MRTVEIKVYKFEELNDEAKEVARKWWREGMDRDFSLEVQMITESMQETLSEEGFEINKRGLQWDLSNSQGDYVGIEGEFKKERLHELIMSGLNDKEKKRYKLLAVDSHNIELSQNIRYQHYYGQQVDVEVINNIDEERYPLITQLYEKVNDIAEGILKDEVSRLRGKLKSQGYNEIEYYYSDECIDEYLKDNDYEFTEDGKKFKY